MEKIGRFVVGLYWKQMSLDQRRDYQKLFSAATQRDWEGTPVKNSSWIKRKRPSKKTFSLAREL
jgi:ABC-type transporter MlaC component